MNSLKRNSFYFENIEDIASCIGVLSANEPLEAVIGLTVFIHASGDNDFRGKKKLIHSSLDGHLAHLPVSVISQPPEADIALEIWTHNACSAIEYKHFCNINYTLYTDSAGKWIWAFGSALNNHCILFDEQATLAFQVMHSILSQEGFTMDDIVRQWNYIPHILKKTTGENRRFYQNYQQFNDIRYQFYDKYKCTSTYPAATGIGMDYGTVTIDFAALKPHPHTDIVGLNNPNQTAAYRYGQEVLVGEPLNEHKRKRTPLFERAKSIRCPGHELIFVSGTASIRGENTVGQDDIVQQTIATINNLLALTDKKYIYLRVYVKNKKDMGIVKKICKLYYKNISILCVKADICRDNLLVEIEGEAETWTKE